MKKYSRIIAFVLILGISVFLESCARADGSYERNLEQISQMAQTETDTPIGGIRTGVPRAGISGNDHQFECTDDGVYYFADSIPCQYDIGDDGILDDAYAGFLFFCPHDSDQMIKLCGRPDCTHDGVDCNACFMNPTGGVTYYNGHLYVAEYVVEGDCYFRLYRLNLDGTERVKVGEFGDMSKQYGGHNSVKIVDGCFTYNLKRIEEKTGETILEHYYYALDGSMKKPKLSENVFYYYFFNQDLMDEQISYENGMDTCHVFKVDIRNDQWEQVFETSDYLNGYWGTEAGYVLDGNQIKKVSYEDGSEHTLFDTGLEGDYYATFYPDFIAISNRVSADGSQQEIQTYYFFSWDGELLGQLPVDFPHTAPRVVICGETQDRIYLQTSRSTGLPTYYLEKSDFSSGSMELHSVVYPDLSEEAYAELFESRRDS